MLILINKEEEHFTDHPNLHHVIVSGNYEETNYIPLICKITATSYLEKHPEYRLAYPESWEYLADSIMIDKEEEK